MNKAALREKYRAVRDEIHSKEKDALVIANIRAFEVYQKAKTVLIYDPIGSEIDIRELARDNSKEFFMPRMLKGRQMEAVRYFDGVFMKRNRFLIDEPIGEAFSGRIDLVLAPALASSKFGYRLGYGGGYYDRYLVDRDCIKAAIVYSDCVTGASFESEHDIKMDCIITDTCIYDLREKK